MPMREEVEVNYLFFFDYPFVQNDSVTLKALVFEHH